MLPPDTETVYRVFALVVRVEMDFKLKTFQSLVSTEAPKNELRFALMAHVMLSSWFSRRILCIDKVILIDTLFFLWVHDKLFHAPR